VLDVPIVGYHSIDNNKARDSTSVSLFAKNYCKKSTYRLLMLCFSFLALLPL
jgi:hypothetical protein